MKITVTCKLDAVGAHGFIKPIADIAEVTKVDVFRDQPALAEKKTTYHSPKKNINPWINQLTKLWQMVRFVNSDTDVAIGIYEIPHGLLAFIIGKLKKIPVIVCIIGNPGDTTLLKGFRKVFTYFMYKRVDAVTVTGNKSKQIVINNGISPNTVFILPNSINVDVFTPRNIKKKYDIINLGRLSPEKELKNLLYIVAELKKKKPDILAGIAGKGPEYNQLKKTIKKLKLEENVHLLGYVDNIVDFYNSGQVFVLTSSTEGLPRTIIEAMACGIPCVASNVGDMTDIIKNGKNGYLINNYNNIIEFSSKIEHLLLNFGLYRDFSKKNVIYVKNHFSYAKATKFWQQTIKTIKERNND